MVASTATQSSTEIVASGNQCHGRKEQQQTADKYGFRFIDEQVGVLEVGTGAGLFSGQVGYGVEGRRQETGSSP